MPPDTSFLVNGFKPTIAAADPREVMAFKQNQQAGAQQLQEGAIGLQEKQRDLKDQQILSDAMQASGGDAQKGLMIGVKNGLSPKAFFATQQAMLKNAGTVAETNKNNAQAESDWYSAQEKSNKMVSGTTGALLNLPPSQRAAAYPAAMQKLAKDLKVDPATLPQDYAAFGGDAALVQFHDQHLDNAEQIAAQKAAYEKKAADQKLIADKAEEDRKAALAPSVLKKANNEAVTTTPNDAGLTKEQQTLADQASANAAQTKANQEREGKQRQQEIGLRQQEVTRQQKQFDATFGQGLDVNGHPLSPEERKTVALQDPTAVAQASYQIPPPSSARTSALGKAQWDKILAIDPTYDGTKFAERNKIAQDFSASGATGKQITSADTALAHLGAISKAGEALKNGDIKLLNSIANSVGAQVGGSAKNTYDTIISMVSPEISKAVIGESGGEGERQAMQKNFASDTADQVREQAIGSAATLLGARVHKQAQAYEADMGKPLSRKLSPESQALLDKYSSGGSPKNATAPPLGTISKGHVFLGGDPSKPENWKKQ